MHYYTVKEASLVLGFSTNSIYKFCLNGRLKANRGNSKNGRFRIPHSSLEKFLGTPLAEPSITAALAEHAVTTTQIKKEITALPSASPKLVVNSTVESSDTPLPLSIIRILIVIGLLLILVDLLATQDFSLFPQLLRLGIMAILIILTYQFGGLSHST
jgi:hypothetical protein